MTDNEIINTLEYCADGRDCDDCPYKDTYNCSRQLRLDVVDLINRQKAEIEWLQGKISDFNNKIKEFVESLKNRSAAQGKRYIAVKSINKVAEEQKK